MASESSLIIRNAEARTRIDVAIQKIEATGISFDKCVVTNRDRAVAQVQQLENFASAFEAVAKHLETPPPPKRTPAK